MSTKLREIFFETPKDKRRVFQKPKLVMLSENLEVEQWNNTQPLYFYPFSWLDYLGKSNLREIVIYDCQEERARREICLLEKGKVHFEVPNAELMRLAKERGHRVSIICNLEDLTKDHANVLPKLDFVRVRVTRNYGKISLLAELPNERVLSCIKVYVGEGCKYDKLALEAKNMGIDFFHVAKRLLNSKENTKISDEEKRGIIELKGIEDEKFKVIMPASLDEMFSQRFVITSRFGNSYSCLFSKYRLALKGDVSYPCYTQRVLSTNGEFTNRGNCSDCACIYENDMLAEVTSKMKRYKKPYFAMVYENG